MGYDFIPTSIHVCVQLRIYAIYQCVATHHGWFARLLRARIGIIFDKPRSTIYAIVLYYRDINDNIKYASTSLDLVVNYK